MADFHWWEFALWGAYLLLILWIVQTSERAGRAAFAGQVQRGLWLCLACADNRGRAVNRSRYSPRRSGSKGPNCPGCQRKAPLYYLEPAPSGAQGEGGAS